MDIMQGAEPFFFEGSKDLGILVIHGYTSTTSGVLPWAKALAKEGYTVSGPRLTGHGTRWQDLNQVSWKDWTRDVEQAYEELRSKVKGVFVAGLSMGAALATYLAETKPEILGMIAVNNLLTTGHPLVPLLPLIRRLIPSLPALANDVKDPAAKELAYTVNPTGGSDEWRKLLGFIRPRLGQITCPLLVFKSLEDHVIPRSSALKLISGAGSKDKELIWLDNSYHVATLDYDAPKIIEKSLDFIARVRKGVSPGVR